MSPYLSRGEKEAMIRKVIEQARILETTRIRIFSGLKPDKEEHTLPGEESELIEYALQIAKGKGVQLMLENEPVCYISKLEDYIGMFTSGKYEGLRAWFDIANVYEEGERLSRIDLEKLAPYVDYLHIKDPIVPNEHKYTSLGKGYINYKRIFDVLEEVIKSPVHLSIETHVKDDKWNASHASLDYLHTLLATKRTRYVLVGVGRVSRKHIGALKENNNCTLVGVYDIDIEKSQSTALAYDCINYDSYEALLSDALVDSVSICTPHNTHINLAGQALRQGKRVLCEKPLALSSETLMHYISEVDTEGNTHVVFQNKFNPAVKKFYEFEKKRLGDPQYIAMSLRWWRDADYYRDWHGSRELSGGALITQAIHSLELVTHLTKGSAIRSVITTQQKTRDEITLPDIIVAIVKFESGVVCNIEVCLATRDHNLESSIFVVGTKGSMKVAGVALSEFVHPEQELFQSENRDGHYYGKGHTLLYRTHSNHFLQIPDEDNSLLTKPKDILNTMKLIEVIESAHANRLNHSYC
jgi:predicted dehydrogenase